MTSILMHTSLSSFCSSSTDSCNVCSHSLQKQRIHSFSIQEINEKTEETQNNPVLKIQNKELLDVFLYLIVKLLKKNKNLKPTVLVKPNWISKIRELFKRFLRQVEEENSYIIVAMIYIDKLHNLNPNCVLTQQNIFQLTTVALLLAVKFLDDDIEWNKKMARITGIQNFLLNKLEAKFLNMINFSLHVETQTYQLYLKRLILYRERKFVD